MFTIDYWPVPLRDFVFQIKEFTLQGLGELKFSFEHKVYFEMYIKYMSNMCTWMHVLLMGIGKIIIN